MEVSRIIVEIDAQIAKLQQVRQLLSGTVKTKGRPKGSTNKATTKRRKHKLSPEGLKRIQDAQKKRWAERRKQTAKQAAKSA